MTAIELSKICVLIIEDQPFMAKTIHNALVEIGIGEVLEAHDGAEGLQIYAERGRKINVILLDLNMPKVSGEEVLRYIRNSPDVADPNVPVVVLTGNADEETVHEIMSMNVSGYLLKPVSKRDLAQRIIRAVAAAHG